MAARSGHQRHQRQQPPRARRTSNLARGRLGTRGPRRHRRPTGEREGHGGKAKRPPRPARGRSERRGQRARSRQGGGSSAALRIQAALRQQQRIDGRRSRDSNAIKVWRFSWLKSLRLPPNIHPSPTRPPQRNTAGFPRAKFSTDRRSGPRHRRWRERGRDARALLRRAV